MTVRVGIVGGGFVAGFHLRALEAVRGVEVAGLFSRTAPTRLAENVRAMNLGAGVIYETVRDLAANVDVVALFAPNFTRIPVMEELARAVADGAQIRALVCEKPLARNLAESRRLLAMAEQMGVVTAYFENQIHLPTLQAARAQLGAVAERMGPLVLARAAEEHSGPHNSWFWDPVQQGGGVLSDMGCHSIAVGWHLLTPAGKKNDFLRPVRVQCEVALLKWGQLQWRQTLADRFGVDYAKTPAEDFATGTITFHDPEKDSYSLAQFTVSWMYDKQGLRLLIDGLGPGYAVEVNTLRSPLEIFIGGEAAAEVADAELALEKSTASQGLLAIHPNEPDLYGYVEEWQDLLRALDAGRSPLLDWSYGLEIVRLTMAAYLAAEEGRVVDLTDPGTLDRLESYIPLIQQGRGKETLQMSIS
ncbi:MAG TPA: Gfo/Idh/MocA family oxidoreductase [Acidimicrobiia bacterium]|nr:Gfo/Idh/MocA family oxidoreductase [Acidimicrobiia bacterium]